MGNQQETMVGKISGREMLKNSTPADYAKALKKDIHTDQLNKINIAYLSTYTSEILDPYIKVELKEYGFFATTYFAPFNQFESEVLNIDSGLYQSNPDVIIVHNMVEDTYPDIVTRFSKYSEEALIEVTDAIIHRHKSTLNFLRNNTNATLVIVNFSAIDYQSENLTGLPATQMQMKYIQGLNDNMSKLCSDISSCYILDYSSILSKIGLTNWIDQKLYLMARIPFSGSGQIAFGKAIARMIAATQRVPHKCLVLDLDNTLWGGVIGEDGIANIQLGDNYPGNVFKRFQRLILGLRDQGIFLAIASKNNVGDVLEVFEDHSDCLVKKQDFSVMEIGWNDKATSIKNISKKLNIGLDSIIFFDDSPVERGWVKDQLPEVFVVDVPKNPMEYGDCLYNTACFDLITITQEDRHRVRMVHQEKQRDVLQEKSKTVDDFLTNLQMKMYVGFTNQISIARVSQLTNKTNQFNLTTRRYTVAEIDHMIKNNSLVLHIRVSDCFGDNGISGVAIINSCGLNNWSIDTFLLSCRILSREIETAFLSQIIKILKSKNGAVLYGEYIKTKKNDLVKNFYQDHGFVLSTNNLWKYDLKIEPKKNNFIKTIQEE